MSNSLEKTTASSQHAAVRGYKIFYPDFTCRNDYQFQENTEYHHPGEPVLCGNGFHFCEKASSLFSYYDFDPQNIVCEIEALGIVATKEGENKSCTDHIRIGRRLSWEEVLKVANEGLNNTGHSNTGDRNTGNWNTGYRNTGYRNTGDRNTGNWNTGNWNTGNWNTGNRNTGNWNTGYRNTGDSNTGNWNTGDSNTGYSNTGNRNTGAFCTEDAPFPMFNKPSTWTEKDFLESRAYSLLRNNVDTKIWVPEYSMTDEEKAANKGWKTAEGYVKNIPFKEAFQNAWHNWDSDNRNAFTSLPNFDSDVFFDITGVRV